MSNLLIPGKSYWRPTSVSNKDTQRRLHFDFTAQKDCLLPSSLNHDLPLSTCVAMKRLMALRQRAEALASDVQSLSNYVEFLQPSS